MSDPIFIGRLIQLTGRIEQLLQTKFGAFGDGMVQKATSVEAKLSPALMRSIKFLGAVRNKVAHGEEIFGDEADILTTCERVLAELENVSGSRPKETYSPRTEPKPQPEAESSFKPPPPVWSSPRVERPITQPSQSAARQTTSTYRPRREPIINSSGITAAGSSLLTSIGIALVVYLVVGFGGCLARNVNTGISSNDVLQNSPRYNQYWYGDPLDAYSNEAVYAALFVVLLGSTFATAMLLELRPLMRALTAVAVFFLLGMLLWGLVDPSRIRRSLASTFHIQSSGYTTPSDGGATTVKTDKVTGGRTAGEKIHEIVLPGNQWSQTDFSVSPNQEVMVHHFASNEQITVSLGPFTDSRLQKAGTILPMYTSKNCSNDKGVKAKVQYVCVELGSPQPIKLFARNSVRVGVVIKNRN